MQITLATHIIYRIKYYTQSELIFLLMRDPGLFILLVAVSFKHGRQLDFVLKDEKL